MATWAWAPGGLRWPAAALVAEDHVEVPLAGMLVEAVLEDDVTPDIPAGRELELVIEPRNSQFSADDDRWRAQVVSLRQELRAQVDTTERGRLVPGTKGAISELVVALGSAGVFTAMVDCFRAWLSRDKDRRIDVRWDEDGVERYVTFSGGAVDAETVREIARAAAARVGGQQWLVGTEPS